MFEVCREFEGKSGQFARKVEAAELCAGHIPEGVKGLSVSSEHFRIARYSEVSARRI